MRHPALEQSEDDSVAELSDESITTIADEEYEALKYHVEKSLCLSFSTVHGIRNADASHTDGPMDRVMAIIARRLSDVYLK